MVSFQALPQWHAKLPFNLRRNENEKKWKVILAAFFIHSLSWEFLAELHSQSSVGWIDAWGLCSPAESRWGQRAALINTLHTALEAVWPYIQAQTGHWENRDVSRWPGSWFVPLPCCFIIFFYFFAFSMCQKRSFPIVAFPNKSIINHKSVSLDWQRRRALRLFLASVKRFWTESMRGTRGRRRNGQKKVKCN